MKGVEGKRLTNVVRVTLGMMVLARALVACDAVLGIGDYQDRVGDAGTDGSVLATEAGDEGSAGGEAGIDARAACSPGDVSQFVPGWKPPAAFSHGPCTDAQISALVGCLSDLPDRGTCETFFSSDPVQTNCLACAITDKSASAYGPLVKDGNVVSMNLAGCVARVEGNITATGCGAKMQAAEQCVQAACVRNCPVAKDDAGALARLKTCETSAADARGCATLAAAATSCSTAIFGDGGVAAECAGDVISMVTLFCGYIDGYADGGPG